MNKEAVLLELVTRFLDRFDLRPTRCYYLEQGCVEDSCFERYGEKPDMWCDPCLIEKAVEETR